MENYNKLIRLYIPAEAFFQGEKCLLPEGQGHYIRSVMRKTAGDTLRVFNGRDGEWLARLVEVNKKNVLIELSDQIREQDLSPDFWVIASPVKKEAFDLMVEKSCELGAAKFIPVTCDHTVVHKINQERLQAVSVEAAEQSERLDVMSVAPLARLKEYLNSLDPARSIIFCIERAGVETPLGGAAKRVFSLADAARNLARRPRALLLGPEGGFSAPEIDFISAFQQVTPVTLGRRILKTETALVAGLSGMQIFD